MHEIILKIILLTKQATTNNAAPEQENEAWLFQQECKKLGPPWV